MDRAVDDEIGLYDLYAMLVRWRWLVLGITLASTLAAAVYALTREPQYEYTAAISIGLIQSSEGLVPVESAESVAAQLHHRYGIEAGPDCGRGSDACAVVALSLTAPDDSALEQLSAAANAVVERHTELPVRTVSATELIAAPRRAGRSGLDLPVTAGLGAALGVALGVILALLTEFFARERLRHAQVPIRSSIQNPPD